MDTSITLLLYKQPHLEADDDGVEAGVADADAAAVREVKGHRLVLEL